MKGNSHGTQYERESGNRAGGNHVQDGSRTAVRSLRLRYAIGNGQGQVDGDGTRYRRLLRQRPRENRRAGRGWQRRERIRQAEEGRGRGPAHAVAHAAGNGTLRHGGGEQGSARRGASQRQHVHPPHPAGMLRYPRREEKDGAHRARQAGQCHRHSGARRKAASGMRRRIQPAQDGARLPDRRAEEGHRPPRQPDRRGGDAHGQAGQRVSQQ